VIFPFANLFHILYPAFLFGKSAWIVVPVMVILSRYIFLFASKRLHLSSIDISFSVIVFLSWLIIAIRAVIYSEQKSFLDERYIATSLLFIVFAYHLLQNVSVIKIAAYSVAVQGLLVAAARSINFYFFPDVMLSQIDDQTILNYGGELTRDLLLGSSFSANHIICGMLVIMALMKNSIIKLRPLVFVFIQFFMMLSTFNTGSRFPIVVAILLFVISLSYVISFNIKDIMGFAIVIAAFIVINSFLSIENFNYFERFQEGFGGRDDKLLIGFLLISNSVTDFLIGSSSSLVNSLSVNDTLISDNSYVLIVTSFGVPFALVYFTFLFNIFLKTKSDKLSLLFLIYLVVGLGVTNCVLWEPWVFTAFLGFCITSYYGRISSNKRFTRIDSVVKRLDRKQIHTQIMKEMPNTLKNMPAKY
jgi:hypothetical protein